MTRFSFILMSLTLPIWGLRAAAAPVYDVLVYGGTPAGIAAACSAADEGRQVVLVEPYSFVGGMVTNGLSHTDLRSLESLTGFWWDFNQAVIRHYQDKYGKDSEQVKASWEGNFGEPGVNQKVFEEMLAKREKVTVLTKHAFKSAASTRMMPSSIVSAVFQKAGQEEPVTLHARVYIDASYEGDLMAGAGVDFAIGREDEAAYGEPLAKEVPPGGDGQVQGYNFRWCVTQDPANRVPCPKPEGYQREMFTPVLKHYQTGKLTHAFGEQGKKAIFKVQPPLLPNGKTDINDMSHGLVRLSMPDINDEYPAADEATRARIIQEHITYQYGLLYFLQNDPEVPPAVQADARSYGFPKDEWPEHGHIPEQLYIREARRMKGVHIFTQNDTKPTDEDVRLPLKGDSIAIGDYSHNCHGTGRTGTRFEGKHGGEFYLRNAPFQIPYNTLVPKQVTNLLVPVATSSSHVGFGALRLEPIWTAMGHAAGLAAHIALDDSKPVVQNVAVRKLQLLLHQHRAATLYVSDVPPNSPDFQAVQWLGLIGGLHGLYKPENGKQPEWKKLFGQYAHAYPMHDAGLEKTMDEDLLKYWLSLVPDQVRDRALAAQIKADGRATRREILGALYKLSKNPF
jgi:hypothetical protein